MERDKFEGCLRWCTCRPWQLDVGVQGRGVCKRVLGCAEKFNKTGQRDGLGPQKIFGFLSIMF